MACIFVGHFYFRCRRGLHERAPYPTPTPSSLLITDDVVPKELIVRRSAPNLPSITFVDLPGLRSTAGLKEKTEALAAQYLGGEHCE